MKQAVKLFRALGDPTRLRIVKMLEGGELCVCQLTAALGMGQSRISRHLAILKDCGLIEARRQGKWVHYRLCCRDATRFAGECLDGLREDKLLRSDLNAARKARRTPVCAHG
ncbi:MAG TPA: ArsR family transcriptional regulator [candidate division Zixibacteria bacterium]|jgi:DNA-binding transcriptional ArsR family regulator|nr:ArsR family transcriptional regulator [candidate division Zixibacteria bacterium]